MGRKHFALLASLKVDDGLTVGVAAVHLSSDRRGDEMLDHSGKRSTQLKAIEKGLQHESDFIILGDFNCRIDETVTAGLSHRMVDVWSHLNADQPGCTYDPSANAVAREVALTHVARRLDRILLHTARKIIRPRSAELAFERTIDAEGKPWNISDHFGVACEFTLVKAETC